MNTSVFGIRWLGYYDPQTNLPNLINGIGNCGDFYICQRAGTVNLGSGNLACEPGYWMMLNTNLIWQVIPVALTGVLGIVSINSDTTAAQLIVGTGPISVSTTSGTTTISVANATDTTVGVAVFPAAGAFTVTAGSVSVNTDGTTIEINGSGQLQVLSSPSAGSLAGGILGSMPYQSAPSVTTFLNPNTTTTPMYYKSVGSGGVGTAPTLSQVAFSDISGTVQVNQGGTGQTSYTNGQLLIGNTTGNTLVKTTLTGTTNEVIVTNGTGSITLSTPQPIATTSTPTFASETLTANTNFLTTGATNTTTFTMAALTSSRVFTLPDADSNSVVPSNASPNNFANGVNSSGVIQYARPTGTNVLSYDPVNGILTDTVVLDTALVNMYNLIENISTGVTWKDACYACAATNVNISNPGTATFDSIVAPTGARIFLLNQSTASQIGIYIFNGSSSAMTRSADMSTWDEVVGSIVPIQAGGTIYGDSAWINTNNSTGTLGVTAIAYMQWQMAYVGGTGVTVTGNVISIGQSVATSASPTFATMNLTNNTNQVVIGTTNTSTITMASLTGSRIFTLPDANSNSVRPLGSATAGQFLQYIGATGVQNLAALTTDSTIVNTTGTYGVAKIPTTQIATNVEYYLPMVTADTTGNQTPYVDSTGALHYNPSTGTLTATTFSGAFTGAATQLLTTAETATATYYLGMVSSDTTGNKSYYVDGTGVLNYNPFTGTLSATTFAGTATAATEVSITQTVSGSYYPVMANTSIAGAGNTMYVDATGVFRINSGVVYATGLNAATEALTANTNQLVLGTTNTTTVTMASLTGSHIFTLPDAASNPIRPLGSGTVHEWVSYIDATGAQNLTQPAFSDISGTIANSQTSATASDAINTIVLRDGSGNFAAGTITANVTGTSSIATNLSGTSVNSVPYQSASATTSYATSVNSAVFATSGAGVPSFVTTLPGVNSGATIVTDPTTGSIGTLNTALADIYSLLGSSNGLSPYSASITYGVGFVIRGDGTNGLLNAIYCCNTAATTGSFVLSKWDLVTLSANSSNLYNTVKGVTAGNLANLTGNFNTCIGYGAAASLTSGSNIVAVGYKSLNALISNGNSTAIGYQAGSLATGTGNQLFGYNSGSGLTKAIATLGTITGGSSYTNGTYNGVTFSLSSGTAMTTYPVGQVDVSGGAVTTIYLFTYGMGGDLTTVLTVTAAQIGGTGSGFSVPIATQTACANNTLIGGATGSTLPTPSNNLLLSDGAGNKLLYASASGGNVSIGHNALVSGFGAGASIYGDDNVAIGESAMQSNTLGYYNVAIGLSALANNTTTHDTVAVGYQALQANTTGLFNLAIGSGALRTATATNNCVAIGYGALYASNVSGSGNNTAIGVSALTASTSGSGNTAIGTYSLYAATTPSNNTAIGASAFSNNITGANGTAVGYSAGNLVTGTGNQLFGYIAGYNITTGSYNTYLGSFTGTGLATSSNNVILSDGQGNITFQASGTSQPYKANAAWTLTDNSGAALTFTSVTSTYSNISNRVTFTCNFTYPSTADVSAASIKTLPVACNQISVVSGFAAGVGAITGYIAASGTSIALYSNATGLALTNAALSLAVVTISGTYSS